MKGACKLDEHHSNSARVNPKSFSAKSCLKLTMLFSLRFGFTQNLANHILDCASPKPLLLLQKPLIQLGVNALLEDSHAFNTNNYVKQEK